MNQTGYGLFSLRAFAAGSRICTGRRAAASVCRVVAMVVCLSGRTLRCPPRPAVAREPHGCGWFPALEPQLLGLLLDVLVVQRRAVLGGADAGADLDGDLLQRRALDRRAERQRTRY